ncbi:MAG: hypothetical protein J0H55_13435 [Chitinophagaceae bacterium]|nr:hypothetical protein [Chitinophagaceae bacterium]
MIAVVTGDIVNSAKVKPTVYLKILKGFLEKQGKPPKSWEIFRGDSFQFKCKPEDAFRKFLLLKSKIKQISGLDIRISIGVGTLDYEAPKISESNGSAFVNSGRTFDTMKGSQYLVFTTGNNEVDKILNLLARFASPWMDGWTVAGALAVEIILEHPRWNQQQIAARLKINQSAVSQNRKRTQLDTLLEFDEYYRTIITSLKP